MSQNSLYRQLRPGPGKDRDEVASNQRSRLIAATIETVASEGYDGMTVSKVTQLAGVSKASFYEQFDGKDECLTATCDEALRAAASAVLRGERSGKAGRERLQTGLTALAELITAHPKGAKLLLVDGLASTPEIREHIARRFGLLQALARERLTPAGRDECPGALCAAIVCGIEHHARRCLLGQSPHQIKSLVDPLLDWALGFNCESAATVFAARRALPGATAQIPANPSGRAARTSYEDRDLLLAAALRLASIDGYGALSPSSIRRTAGVSRRSFNACFADAGSCFLTAVEDGLEALFAEAGKRKDGEESWEERTPRTLSRLAASLAADPDLVRLAFVESIEAAPASLIWRQGLIARWAEALYREAPAGHRPSPPVAEASIAAIWGLFTDLAVGNNLHLLPTQVPSLAFLVLTPAVGASRAARLCTGTSECS